MLLSLFLIVHLHVVFNFVADSEHAHEILILILVLRVRSRVLIFSSAQCCCAEGYTEILGRDNGTLKTICVLCAGP